MSRLPVERVPRESQIEFLKSLEARGFVAVKIEASTGSDVAITYGTEEDRDALRREHEGRRET